VDGIAKSWLWLADAYVPPLEAYPKVRDAAVRALKLDDQEAEAHVYLAESKRILDWDLDDAEAEFNRAVAIDPNSTPSNYFIAALYAVRGDRDKALAYLQRTSKIDPASLWVSNFACELYRYFGLYDERSRPESARCSLIQHLPTMANRCSQRCIGRWGASMTRLQLYKKAQDFTGRPGFGLAITYARMNRRKEALETLNAAVAGWGYRPGDGIAHVYITLARMMTQFANSNARASSARHLCTALASPLNSRRFVPINAFCRSLKKIGLEPEKVFCGDTALIIER